MDDIDKFEQRVDRSGDCHVFIGHINTRGYGAFYVDGRQVLAHRWAYERHRGAIPEGAVIDHLCRNRRCVRVDHLEAVTIAVNVLRGVGPTARHVLKTHCPQGHPYDERNTYRDRRGGRHCRRCRADSSLRIYYARKDAR